MKCEVTFERTSEYAIQVEGYVMGLGESFEKAIVKVSGESIKSIYFEEDLKRILNQVSRQDSIYRKARTVAAVAKSFLLLLLQQVVIRKNSPEKVIKATDIYNKLNGSVSLLKVPANCRLQVHAAAESGDHYLLKEENIHRKEIGKKGRTSDLQPLVVTSIGRSGSTWFQHILSQHPKIKAFESHNYEALLARRILQDVAETGNRAPVNPNKCGKGFTELFKDGEMKRKYLEKSEGIVEERLRRAKKVISSYYKMAGAKKNTYDKLDGKNKAKYFTEKNMRPRHLIKGIYENPKEIFLVRDFRDVVASMILANKKWNTQYFGRSKVKGNKEMIYRRAKKARGWILEPYKNADQKMLVKYEHLVNNQIKTIKKVLDYLELGDDAMDVKKLINKSKKQQTKKEKEKHMTSESTESSIGKWKNVLSAELSNASHNAFEEFLRVFEYD